MTAELEVLSDVAGRLDHAAIPYMLTGSIALSYYAQPRMTRDIDLVVELAGRDARSVAALFTPEYYVSDADIDRALTGVGMFNVLHLDKLVKVDLIVRKDAPYRRQEFARRQRVQMPGFEAWIVSREDLILSKRGISMRDTTPEFQSLVDAAYAGLTPAQRVRMCTEMFDTAREIVLASLPADLDASERRFRLCERFYGDLADRALRR